MATRLIGAKRQRTRCFSLAVFFFSFFSLAVEEVLISHNSSIFTVFPFFFNQIDNNPLSTLLVIKKNKNHRERYTEFPAEGLVVNVLGATLMGLAILMPVLMLTRRRHRGPSSISSQSSGDHDEESERL